MRAPRVLLTCFAACLAAAFAVPVASASVNTPSSGTTVPGRPHIDCSQSHFMCTEVGDSEEVFGGPLRRARRAVAALLLHPARIREPDAVLRRDPDGPGGPAGHPASGYNFQLFATIWFGMVLCDTQSYPEQEKTCTPDSDSNIVDPRGGGSTRHRLHGAAVLPAGVRSSSSTASAARRPSGAWRMTIDSLSQNPVTGTASTTRALTRSASSTSTSPT